MINSAEFPGAFGLFSASVGDSHHHQVRLGLKLTERDWSAARCVMVFALELGFGAAVCAGTMMAIFAWTGSSL
jgi:hypothetical protein